MAQYRELLERIRQVFPQPTSNRIHDAYFSYLVQHALRRIDDMKGDKPFLGRMGAVDYEAAQRRRIPEEMGDEEAVIREIAGYLEGIVIWGHPLTQENVVPPTTIPSVVGMMSAAIYNPNVIWDAYSHRVAEAEVEATTMVADLVGYDPEQAGGVFTFGGTGTILYGVRVGLEKALPGTMTHGLRRDAKLVCSDTSHYSKLNVAGWLGLGTQNVVSVPTDSHNSMNLDALAQTLDRLVDEGHPIAAIISTMGTTDAFGIDPLAGICEVRNRLVQARGLPYIPHVHADAVIGWPWTVFNDYDFAENPLQFGARTVRSLRASRAHIQHLHLADSIGVDFHKTGYAPYISSLFLLKKRTDLNLVSREQELMPYLYQFGEYHPGVYTLESSRNGGSTLAALANLKLLGKQGYRVILGHIVEMAERLREQLEANECLDVLNDYNFGPVTLFRAYPPGVDARAATRAEATDAACREQLLAHNDYNRRLFDALQEEAKAGHGVHLSITDCYRKSAYGEPILALKSFIMSPFTDVAAVDLVVEKVLAARERMGR